jgi:hypothetical protein
VLLIERERKRERERDPFILTFVDLWNHGTISGTAAIV